MRTVEFSSFTDSYALCVFTPFTSAAVDFTLILRYSPSTLPYSIKIRHVSFARRCVCRFRANFVSVWFTYLYGVYILYINACMYDVCLCATQAHGLFDSLHSFNGTHILCIHWQILILDGICDVPVCSRYAFLRPAIHMPAAVLVCVWCAVAINIHTYTLHI